MRHDWIFIILTHFLKYQFLTRSLQLFSDDFDTIDQNGEIVGPHRSLTNIFFSVIIGQSTEACHGLSSYPEWIANKRMFRRRREKKLEQVCFSTQKHVNDKKCLWWIRNKLDEKRLTNGNQIRIIDIPNIIFVSKQSDNLYPPSNIFGLKNALLLLIKKKFNKMMRSAA